MNRHVSPTFCNNAGSSTIIYDHRAHCSWQPTTLHMFSSSKHQISTALHTLARAYIRTYAFASSAIFSFASSSTIPQSFRLSRLLLGPQGRFLHKIWHDTKLLDTIQLAHFGSDILLFEIPSFNALRSKPLRM